MNSPTTPEENDNTQKTFMERFWELYNLIMNTRIIRGLLRFGNGRGWLLAGGIAYSAMFSITAGLTIGFTVLATMMGSNVKLRSAIYSGIENALPGILSVNGHKGIINPDDLVLNTNFSIASVVAVILLVYSAMAIMMALKSSIRAMFGIEQVPDNIFIDKLRDLVGFITFALGIAITGILGFVNSKVGGALLRYIGIESSDAKVLLYLGTLLLNALIDALVLFILLKIVSRVNVPKKDLFIGLGIFAVLSGILRYLGTAVVSGSAQNPLLAGFAALVTLLLWVNLLARVILMVSAFMSNPPLAPAPEDPDQLHANETPNYITLSSPHTLKWPQHRITGAVDMQTKEEVERERLRERNRLKKKPKTPVQRLIAWRIKYHQRKIDYLVWLRD